MDYSLRRWRRTRRVLDGRSVVVAIFVLLVGAGLGFAGGDVYGRHSVQTTSPTTRATQTKTKTWDPASPEGRQQLLSCLARKNVPYLDPRTADFKTPPPGVDDATLNAALGVCYRDLLTKPQK